MRLYSIQVVSFYLFVCIWFGFIFVCLRLSVVQCVSSFVVIEYHIFRDGCVFFIINLRANF